MSTPVYVQIRNYKQVLKHVDALKQNLLDARTVLEELHAIRGEENDLMHTAQSNLSQMKQHFAAIQKGAFDR